jgi:hypothetical protein
MSNLADKHKYRLIVRHHERRRAASDGDSNRSPEVLAREECQLSKAMVSYIKNGRDIKHPEKRAHFDSIFRKRVAAEPGSNDYRALWADVQATAHGDSDPLRKRYLVATAYGHWSDIALDKTRPDAERLLVGRMAQFVLYGWSRGNGGATFMDVVPSEAKQKGREVNAAVIEILSRNPTAPSGLFDQGAEAAAAELGYRIFRIRLFADRIGWQTPNCDADRARYYEEAFNAGLSTDLMLVHEELEHAEVGHPYRAFVLATHASEWHRAGEYAIDLLRTFPEILTASVAGIKPMLEDRDVWPGLAAMMVHRWREIPTGLHRVLENPEPRHAGAVSKIRAMMAGVKANERYLSVLGLEK